jgi:CDGSH-type Zn-finger protein
MDQQNKNNTGKIKVIKNGPYIVSGQVPLTEQTIILDADGQCLEWRETKNYSISKVYSLCRCGKSKSLPFCDGRHLEINFDGTETADRRPYLDTCQKFAGPELDLTDKQILCADAGFCDRAGGILELVSNSDDPKKKKTAIEECRNCPSGRLVLWDKAGQAIEPVLSPSIVLMVSSNGEFVGPIWVRGAIPIDSADGETYENRNRVTLCGCGRSLNKPFCDGTHRQKQP